MLAGRVYGARAFSRVMSVGDTCDYVARYGDLFEEGIATLLLSGELERTVIKYARHANMVEDTNKVSFPAGAKHIFLGINGDRVAAFLDALRPQSFSQGERDQACANIGLPQSGDKAVIPQATAWVGWTKDTTHHNKAIRIVNDASGGSAGGSVDFSTLFGRTATDNFTIAQANLPGVNFIIPANQFNHDHSMGGASHGGGTFTNISGGAGFSAPIGATVIIVNAAAQPQMIAQSGGSGTALSAAIDMRVKHVNCIIGIKD